jgi:hypothetical protein
VSLSIDKKPLLARKGLLDQDKEPTPVDIDRRLEATKPTAEDTKTSSENTKRLPVTHG